MAAPIVIDLTFLTNAQGFIIQGDAAGDNAGYSLSSAGDVNNDGYDDLIVGALEGDNGGYNSGEAYVIYGGTTATRSNIDLTNLTVAQGFIIQGDAAGDNAGYSVSSAGDVNNDGFDDLIVGACFGDNGGDGAGEAYVLYGVGSATRNNIDLTNLTRAQGFMIQGDSEFANAGYSVSSAGDVNNDGYDDLIIGAPSGDGGTGIAYVIYGVGTATRGNIDLTNLTRAQGFTIQGDVAGDFAGNSVASAGDVNNDGIDDLIVGARFGDNGGNNAGEAYVIYGVATAGRDNIDLTNLTRVQGYIIQGDAAGDTTGYSVSFAGDVNNDGYDDLIVGAPYGGSGETFVIYGVAVATRDNIDLTNLTGAQGFIIRGDPAGDYAGYSVSTAGDVNNDGYDDLIVGAPLGDNGGFGAGEAYVIYGVATATRDNIDLTSLTRSQGFIIQGDAAGDGAGLCVSSAGDVNNDGYDDLFVGAHDIAGNSAGEAYVIYGGPQFAVPPALPNTDTILGRPGNSLTGTCAEFAMASYLATNPLAPASLTKLKADGWTFLTSQTQNQPDFFNVTDLGYSVNAKGMISNFNASALVARSADALVLSITGTDETTDKLLDWAMLGAQLAKLQPLFQGVYDYAAANGLKVIVTGHSMGAAMAQMFFAQFGNEGVEVEGVNFASPGFAQSALESLYTLDPIFDGITSMLDYFNILATTGHFHQYWNENDPIKAAAFFQRNFGNKHDFEFSDASTGVGPGATHSVELYLDIVRYVSLQHTASQFAGLPSIDTILRDYDKIVVNANKVSMGGTTGDWIVGGTTGPDTLEGAGWLNPLNAKREALFGSFGSDVINAYGKDDILFGARDHDFLYGGGGRDILVGGIGADMLEGGAGKDTMIGGFGGDRFVFTALSDSGITANTSDVIVGFDANFGDKIDLRALGLVEFIGGIAFSGVGQVRIGTKGSTVTIEVNDNDDTLPDMVILLEGLVSFSSNSLLI